MVLGTVYTAFNTSQFRNCIPFDIITAIVLDEAILQSSKLMLHVIQRLIVHSHVAGVLISHNDFSIVNMEPLALNKT